MAIKFFNETDTVKTETLSATYYGDPGIGKTSLSFTAKNPLLLDFDMGVQRAIGRKDTVRVDSWNDVLELMKSPELIKLAPETIIVDTGGTMLDNYIANYVKIVDPKNSRTGGELSLQGYGAMKSVFKQFKDWTKTLGANVIFICHATKDNDKEGKMIPRVTGGALDILRQESDLIGYMYSDKNKRVIDFRPIDSHDGKDCAQVGLVEIPDATNPEFETFLQGIITRTLDKMNDMSEKQKEVILKIKEYKTKISKIKSVNGFNDMVKTLKDNEEKNIQLQVFAHLKKHGTDKKIASYHSKTKKFVNFQEDEI